MRIDVSPLDFYKVHDLFEMFSRCTDEEEICYIMRGIVIILY